MKINSQKNKLLQNTENANTKGISFILLVLIFSSFEPSDIFSQFRGNVNIDNFTPLIYNESPQNWGILQDKSGILYFGNESGIMTFDGLNWRLIPLSNQSSSGPLVMNEDGRIFVGGINEFGYLEPDEYGTLKYKSLVDKISLVDRTFDSVWYIKCVDEDVYFVTDNILFRFRDGKIKTWRTKERFKNCFVINKHAYIWIGGKGIAEIKDDSLTNIPHGDFFKNLPFNFISQLSGSKYLIGTYQNGLFTFDFSSQNLTSGDSPVKIFHTECDKFLMKNILFAGAKLKNGNIALGTLKSGIVLIDSTGKLISIYNKQNGLQNEIVHYLFEDKEGSLWASLNKGIARIDLSAPVSFWNNTSGLDDIVSDIIRYKNTLFIGDFNGLNYLQSDKLIHVQGDYRECLSFYKFKNPASDNNDKLLMGISKNSGPGVFELDDFIVQKIIPLEYGAWVFAQSNVNPERIFIGTAKGLVSAVFRFGEWRLEGKIGDFEDDIRSIIIDKNENIWLGTDYSGVIKIIRSDNILKPKEIIRYGIDNGLHSLLNLALFTFKNKIMVGSQKGLFCFSENENKFIPDSTFGVSLCDGSTSVTKFAPDYAGNIWIVGKRNNKMFIVVAVPDNNKYKLITEPLKMIPDMNVYSIYPEADGKIWIGGSEGLFLYQGRFNENFPGFKTLIRTVAISLDSIITIGSAIETNLAKMRVPLKYDYNSLSFQYTATTYYNTNATEYKTYLEGFDNNWSEWSNDNKRTFTNLSEGNYKFHVIARNVYHKLGNEAIYSFTILPPWYRTIPAYLCYILFLFSFTYLIAFLNSKRLKKANLYLENIVIKRTKEIVKTNIELAKQKEEITSQRDQLKELNITKDRFFSVIAHDLKNPFNSILGLTDLMKNSFEEFNEDEIASIIDDLYFSSRNAYELLRNLLEWSMSQLNGIEFKPRKVQVNGLIKECVELINFSAKEKKINISNEIDEGLYIYADSDLTKTIIRNLLANAVKFSNINGKIKIYGKYEKEYAKITIEDNGIGMSAEVINKLFRTDTKNSTLGTANERGTGLGLILCKEFVEKQGGAIFVESKPDKYSKFTFTLPA